MLRSGERGEGRETRNRLTRLELVPKTLKPVAPRILYHLCPFHSGNIESGSVRNIAAVFLALVTLARNG